MSDPNYAHEFVSNRKGFCQQYVSSGLCHLPEVALVHQRYHFTSQTIERAKEQAWARIQESLIQQANEENHE